MIPLFYKIRDAVSLKTKLRIYYAYVFSRINYCIEIYSNTSLVLVKRLGDTQSRLLKIFRLENLESKKYFKLKNEILSLESIKKLSLAKLAYKFYYGLMPLDMSETLRSPNQNSMRSSNRLKKLKVNLIKNRYSKTEGILPLLS